MDTRAERKLGGKAEAMPHKQAAWFFRIFFLTDPEVCRL
jgi:hypothetical protein